MKYPALIVMAHALCLTACGRVPDRMAEDRVPVYGYEIVRSYPKDPMAFTQGFQYQDGYLYESTGLYGQSSLRQVELETGRVLRRVNLPGTYFGEGLAIVGDQIYQLTWREQTAFIFDLETCRRIGALSYDGEGWGLAFDGAHLVMSDGTTRLRFLAPDTFDHVRSVDVRADGVPVDGLNELAWIDGRIWANIFHTNRLARIRPDTGEVTAWVDLSGLPLPEHRTGREDVLNGIAHDSENDRLFVTGKRWSRVYHIRVIP